MISEEEKVEALKTICSILENGDRLAEDAENLFELDRLSSAFALCILAQEEYGKAFLVHLVQADAIPWSADLQRALRDHATKQLADVIMHFLLPDDEDFLGWLEARSESGHKLTPTVADALNIIRHERIPRRDSWAWTSSEDNQPCDRIARRVADGQIDKKKQDALYVGVGSKLQITSNPRNVNKQTVETELERTKRIGEFLSRYDAKREPMKSIEYDKICWSLRVMFGLCTMDDYNANWWAWSDPF
jgi:AbiV family abortive infection protein